MRISNRLRATIAGACHAVGAVWAVAAVLRLIFGVAVTFPLLPPLDLARVHVVPAFAVALGLFALGALVGRHRAEVMTSEGGPPSDRSLAEPPAVPVTTHAPGERERVRSATNQP